MVGTEPDQAVRSEPLFFVFVSSFSRSILASPACVGAVGLEPRHLVVALDQRAPAVTGPAEAGGL